ncbi:hypothetical protein [Paenibacillus mendelii]|uniref:Polyhydroxyalkanoic acid system protein n=1 Tax=Paenibacillus mendelii TaxID=206163 RepID=A0ABV6JKP7_9BACL|nr:hypothetical protein [Paenibacillus mendelii]MCQ6563019.1 hypothetical protein [Paenibacillus mendelii]
MNINLNFTAKGKIAIENFTNEELLEILTRYSNTLKKKYAIDISYPLESNQSICEDGVVKVIANNIECDVDLFFRELGRDIKVPLKKRLQGNLDNVFKMVRE